MTLLEIQAIRALPDEYVVEGVRAVRCDKVVVVACPGKPALIYDPEIKEWRLMNGPRVTEFDLVMWEQVRAQSEALKTSNAPLAVKTGKLSKSEAEAMGLPCEPKGDVGKLFD